MPKTCQELDVPEAGQASHVTSLISAPTITIIASMHTRKAKLPINKTKPSIPSLISSLSLSSLARLLATLLSNAAIFRLSCSRQAVPFSGRGISRPFCSDLKSSHSVHPPQLPT
ncbi:uncharacterized protein MYCGRDRAFT_106719 [Zymoseptoria tritici IPO323]|uniref:Uncharacterized protein n=1 Tax=Zymoseptoria tritici (strain CBS 115943 / IPO323) TaxID=336722 RepID=F9XSC0_ZYMTI|nr:uncharacterized protein MYCGRDRAFT_106719 [Zymoseptoria tritici IPO323]EGP81862.1 hypothetical protein MYCGRDRAFT_106719 [Zymoseptoria tritici IPO323]